MMYDYREAVKKDVRTYINEEVNLNDYNNREELEEFLNDELFVADSVTGNGSGSYTFSTYEAEENLAHNLDLLGEALEAFSCSFGYLTENGAEAADVTIRCYLLNECITEVLDELGEVKEYTMLFETRDREAGNTIDRFATYEEAVEALRQYEAEDRADGTYTPDFYEIVEAR